jgi:hypothetical protein
MLVALCGQLAMLAHAALVAHVTCGVDGDLIHLRADARAAVPARDAARAAVDDANDAHDRCLLDEDGEAACPNAGSSSGAPVPSVATVSWNAHRVRCAARHAPLYRLAPKTSPPA